ncbi:unnamed protein product [Allacma fusca]|uniref:Uncharacterized protein n=1 Tax=Allacma fusca TaxID=39272 RepID=A0A8J2LE20_9HEXA|nr:unnamed protein product [Allacma fusca]
MELLVGTKLVEDDELCGSPKLFVKEVRADRLRKSSFAVLKIISCYHTHASHLQPYREQDRIFVLVSSEDGKLGKRRCLLFYC